MVFLSVSMAFTHVDSLSYHNLNNRNNINNNHNINHNINYSAKVMLFPLPILMVMLQAT
ncbi:hypothetical protein A2U01_0099103 [Trifolium medium]|nr:hypothetical protein [Trifolium medium]